MIAYFRCQIENQVSDYRLLGASSLMTKSIIYGRSWGWEVHPYFLTSFFFGLLAFWMELIKMLSYKDLW
jgi:hypothetical protein